MDIKFKKARISSDEAQHFDLGDEVLIVQDDVDEVIAKMMGAVVVVRVDEDSFKMNIALKHTLTEIEDYDIEDFAQGTIDPEWWVDTDQERNAVVVGTLEELDNDKTDRLLKSFNSKIDSMGRNITVESKSDLLIVITEKRSKHGGTIHQRMAMVPKQYFKENA